MLSSTLEGGSQLNISSYQRPGSRGFVFSGIADGDYDVTAQSYFPSGERALSEPQRIKVRGADVTGIEMITKPLGAVSGSVVLENSKAAECKGKRRPLFSETLVSAWHNEKNKAKDQPQFIWSLGTPSSPDKQGNISLRNLWQVSTISSLGFQRSTGTWTQSRCNRRWRRGQNQLRRIEKSTQRGIGPH